MFASSTEWLQNKFCVLVWAHTYTIQLFEVEPNSAKESPEALAIQLKQRLGNMALLGAAYKMVHPNWKHICLNPLGVRKHPAALLVSKLASQCKRCSAATSLLRDWVVNGKYAAKPAPSESISSLTHFRYLPCKLFSSADASSPKSMTHTANCSDGRQNAVVGPLSSSRP